jgi:hypothetical protein
MYSGLAQEVLDYEFDGVSGAPDVTVISGWFSGNLGLLNTHLNTSFSGDSPSLGQEEQAIFKQLYLCHYTEREARNATRGIINSTVNDVTLIRDADHQIEFANKSEVSKTLRGVAKDCKEELMSLIAKYNLYESAPLQVVGIDSDQTVYGSDTV